MLKLFPKWNEDYKNYTSADEGEQQALDLYRENDSNISQLSWQPRSLEFGCQLSNHIVSTWHNRVCFPAWGFNCVSTGGHWNVEESDCAPELKEFRFLSDTCTFRVVQEEEEKVWWGGKAMLWKPGTNISVMAYSASWLMWISCSVVSRDWS